MLVSGMLCGCAATPVRLTASPVPPDFSIEVRDYEPDAGALYIVEPDRWFRAATGAEPVTQTYPAATRLLSAEQMAALWEAIEATGEDLGDDAGAWLVVDTTANGRRTRARLNPATDENAGRLIAELRRLAWVRP